jgi:uncharacterized protein YlxW (UPF0749 family)
MPESPENSQPEPQPEVEPEAEAEAEVEEKKPASGRDALLAALRARPGRAQVLVGLLLFAVGFAAATQVRSNEQDDSYGGLRQSDLIKVFDGLAGSQERAENEIERLTETKEDLQSSTSQRQAALELAQQEEAVLSILAGTVQTAGPGIRITITDSAGAVTADIILDLVQELRASGAEAMEFNDRVRVIAQTSIEQADGGISLDGVLVEAPFVIDVIGEPTTLEGSLDFPDGPIEQVDEAGGSLESEQLDEVIIESVVDLERRDFAEPR